MEPVAFPIMAKKNEFIRIRADSALKEALAKAAELHIRSEADEARFLLMKSLGMLAAEEPAVYTTRPPIPHKKQGSS